MERDDEALLEDLWLLLQKERVVFSITSMSRHVIFATIFTPRVVGQKVVNTRSVSGRSTNDIIQFFMKSTVCTYIL